MGMVLNMSNNAMMETKSTEMVVQINVNKNQDGFAAEAHQISQAYVKNSSPIKFSYPQKEL